MRRRLLLVALLGVLVPAPVQGAVELPAGFTARIYVTGTGFDPGTGRGAPGIPSTSTLAFDDSGALYLARTGRRYMGGEVEDIWPIYRIPAGGARLTPAQERRYFYGPPLPNPQVAAVRGGRELFVTTFDRDRRVGVLYRILDGRAELIAGGTPPPGETPLLRQPEGAAADAAGRLYVADRLQGTVVQLDPRGRLLDPRWVAVARPRLLAVDAANHLWVASDGEAEAPWQRGPGAIWRVAPDGGTSLVAQGLIAAGMALSPAGAVFIADRQRAQIFALAPDGRRITFARFTDGDLPRALCFAPAAPGLERAGLAGDLFVVVIRRGAWPVNEILHITGPFEELTGGR